MTDEGGCEYEAIYEIEVEGRLDGRWAGWFDGMTAKAGCGCDGSPATILAGPVADQAALRGILNKVWDLHLTLISVARIERNQSRELRGGNRR